MFRWPSVTTALKYTILSYWHRTNRPTDTPFSLNALHFAGGRGTKLIGSQLLLPSCAKSYAHISLYMSIRQLVSITSREPKALLPATTGAAAAAAAAAAGVTSCEMNTTCMARYWRNFAIALLMKIRHRVDSRRRRRFQRFHQLLGAARSRRAAPSQSYCRDHPTFNRRPAQGHGHRSHLARSRHKLTPLLATICALHKAHIDKVIPRKYLQTKQ